MDRAHPLAHGDQLEPVRGGDDALVALGADVDYRVGQWTPLIKATGRDTRIVKSLIDAGADVNHKDHSGQTPLRAAILGSNVDIVRLLLKAGADVNERNPAPELHTYGGSDDPVLLLVVSGYPRLPIQITRMLLEAGADPNYRNFRPYYADSESRRGPTTDGYTALTFAARHGYLPVVDLLRKHGADPCLTRQDGAVATTIAKTHKHPRVATRPWKPTETACKHLLDEDSQ